MSDTKNKKYVVVRNERRVSDQEYDTPVEANTEVQHWKLIIQRWPDNSIIEVVEKDEKKHRIW